MNKVSNQQKKLCCRCQKKKKKKIFKVKKKLKIENINSMFRCSKLTLDDKKKNFIFFYQSRKSSDDYRVMNNFEEKNPFFLKTL